MAGAVGFEPTNADSKTGALPLGDAFSAEFFMNFFLKIRKITYKECQESVKKIYSKLSCYYSKILTNLNV